MSQRTPINSRACESANRARQMQHEPAPARVTFRTQSHTGPTTLGVGPGLRRNHDSCFVLEAAFARAGLAKYFRNGDTSHGTSP